MMKLKNICSVKLIGIWMNMFDYILAQCNTLNFCCKNKTHQIKFDVCFGTKTQT